ncbi:MAG: hypothetical protein II491_04235, partial [Prevotella sp.]|nr:hypothetical protein [Prevotella sp.]
NHDLIEAANVMADIQKDVEGWQRYQRYKMMQKQLDNAVSSYLKAETSEDANRFRNEIENLKKSMVEEIGN